MKIFQIVFLIFITASSITAQSIEDDLSWGKKFENKWLTKMLVETDNNDNILVAGIYRGCPQCYVEWEGDTLVTQGATNDDVFIAKIDAEGTLLWHLFIGEEGDESISGFRIDNSNNIVLYIENEDEFTYSSTLFESGYNLIKFNETGELLWSSNIKGARHERYNSSAGSFSKQLSIGCNDEIVIGGSVGSYSNLGVVYDTLEIGNQIIPVDKNNIFIAKLDSNGSPIWVKTYEHGGQLELSSLDATNKQEINVLGFFTREDLNIDENILSVDTIESLNNRNVFIIKIDEEGELVWVEKYFEDVLPQNITTDNSGNIISTGRFRNSIYYEQDTIISNGSTDVLLFVVDSLGVYKWGTTMGDQTTSGNGFVLTNHLNEIYVSGQVASQLSTVMYKYSPTGDLLWELNPTGNSNRSGGDIAFDNSGNLIQSGSHTGNLIIGSETIGSNASGDWHDYILKFENQTETETETENECLTTSISTTSNELNFEVYPNPTSGSIFVKGKENLIRNVDIYLYNSNGKSVIERPAFVISETENFINIHNLPSGLYYLKLVSKDLIKFEIVIKI